MKNKLLFFFGCLCSAVAFGQLNTYDHKIEISDVEDQWHKFDLPDALFEKVAQDMADIRVYGVTENDTLEAPYLLKVGSGQQSRKNVDFNLLNATSNTNGHYFTYEVSSPEAINQIILDIANENFDWKVVLEGSQNQKEWFTILTDYRILAIKNTQTDYSFSELNFTSSKYRFYRLLIKSSKKPEIKAAKISINNAVNAKYKEYTITYMGIHEKDKQTILNIDFKRRLPISMLKINVSDKLDYYRPLFIEYIADSVQTEKGWRYGYRNLTSGTLSSIENNEFHFQSTLAQKLRVTISDYDNQPLHIEGASAKGYVHELIARFAQPATYYLAYGKAKARKPQYDISWTSSKIPTDLTELKLGDVKDIAKKAEPKVAPLFENKFWLWAIMGVIILVLGGFTLKMMRQK